MLEFRKNLRTFRILWTWRPKADPTYRRGRASVLFLTYRPGPEETTDGETGEICLVENGAATRRTKPRRRSRRGPGSPPPPPFECIHLQNARKMYQMTFNFSKLSGEARPRTTWWTPLSESMDPRMTPVSPSPVHICDYLNRSGPQLAGGTDVRRELSMLIYCAWPCCWATPFVTHRWPDRNEYAEKNLVVPPTRALIALERSNLLQTHTS